MSDRALCFAIRLVLRLWYGGTKRDAAPMLEALIAASGRTCVLPKGTYAVRSTIDIARGANHVAGQGRRATTINFVPTGGGGE